MALQIRTPKPVLDEPKQEEVKTEEKVETKVEQKTTKPVETKKEQKKSKKVETKVEAKVEPKEEPKQEPVVETKEETSAQPQEEVKEEEKVETPVEEVKTDKPKKVSKIYDSAINQIEEGKKELEILENTQTTNAVDAQLVETAKIKAIDKIHPLVYHHVSREKTIKIGISLPEHVYKKVLKFSAAQHDKVSRVIAGILDKFLPDYIYDQIKEEGDK